MQKNIALSIIISFAILLSTIPGTPLRTAYGAGENLALGKEAFASSKYNDTDTYSPDKINDGNYATLWSDGRVKYTGPVAGYYYIAVDLADSYIINTIKAYPRIDFDDSAKVHDWRIQLSNTRDFSDAVTIATLKSTCAFGGHFTFNVDSSASYRYVRIASPNAYFTCGELEVFGEKFDPATMSGGNLFLDTVDTAYNGPANVCSTLGIIKEVDDTTFSGYKLLTRGSALSAVVRLMDYIQPTNPTQHYSDVPPSSPFFYDVAVAYEHNIISDADAFYPDSFITQGELYKLILYAFGYGNAVARYNDWRAGVASLAGELKLYKHVGLNFDSYISRGDGAQVIYNALLAPMMNNLSTTTGLYSASDNTALYDIYKMYIIEGVLEENCASSLIRPLSKSAHHISLNGNTYYDASDVMQSLIGKSVGILVSEDSSDVIVGWEDVHRTATTRVYSDAIVSASNGLCRYEDDSSRTKSIRFNEKEVYVLNNYSAEPDWTYDAFTDHDGYIDFIDNNNDGTIEVISISTPQVLIGGYVLTDNGNVNVVDKSGAAIQVDSPAWTKFYKNGRPTTPGKLNEHDVLFVYLSANDATLRIEAFSSQLSGTVDSIDDDSVTIDSISYPLSAYYSTITNADHLLKIGKLSTILLDERGRIIYVVGTTATATEDVVGFVYKVYNDPYEEDLLSISIYNSLGSFVTYDVGVALSIDDVGYKKDRAKKLLSSGTLDIKDKIVRYSTNSQSQLTQLQLLQNTNTSLGSDVVYIKNGDGIYNKGWLIQPLRSNTLCLTLPKVGTEFVSSGYEKYFISDTVTSHLHELGQITERWDFYDTDATGYPSVAVRYVSLAASSDIEANPCTAGDYDKPLLIKNVSTFVDDDEEVSYCLNGLDMSGNECHYKVTSSIKNVFLADDIQRDHFEWLSDHKDIETENLTDADYIKYTMPINQLKTGDMVRVEWQDDRIIGLERTFEAYSGQNGTYSRPKDGTYFSAGTSYPQYPDAQYRLVYGLSKGIIDDVFYMSTCERVAGEGPLTQNVLYHKLSSVVVCEGTKLTTYQGDELPAILTENQETLLFTSVGRPKCLILYK